MTPYEVYFYSSGAVEEQWGPKDLGLNKANAMIGYGLGGFLSFALMIVDDLRFSDSWHACDVTLGQAWGYFGLTIAASIGFGILGQLVGAFASQGDGWAVATVAVSLVLSLVQYLFFAIYAVIVAHGLSDGRARPSLSV